MVMNTTTGYELATVHHLELQAVLRVARTGDGAALLRAFLALDRLVIDLTGGEGEPDSPPPPIVGRNAFTAS